MKLGRFPHHLKVLVGTGTMPGADGSGHGERDRSQSLHHPDIQGPYSNLHEEAPVGLPPHLATRGRPGVFGARHRVLAGAGSRSSLCEHAQARDCGRAGGAGVRAAYEKEIVSLVAHEATDTKWHPGRTRATRGRRRSLCLSRERTRTRSKTAWGAASRWKA